MLRFIDGDRMALDVLYQRYREPIASYLTRIVGRSTGEDLSQATFLSLVRGRGRYQRSARFRPWLYAIATNAARDFLRRRRIEQLTSKREMVREEAVGPPDADPGMERAVHRALEQLPESQRLAIVMHRFQNLSFAEIAQALELSESAVKVRAHRGYEKLRELLRDLWEGP